jgi:hypothetical protein
MSGRQRSGHQTAKTWTVSNVHVSKGGEWDLCKNAHGTLDFASKTLTLTVSKVLLATSAWHDATGGKLGKVTATGDFEADTGEKGKMNSKDLAIHTIKDKQVVLKLP